MLAITGRRLVPGHRRQGICSERSAHSHRLLVEWVVSGFDGRPGVTSRAARQAGAAAFAHDTRGGVAVVFSLCLLVLAVLVAGGIEMADLVSERNKLRNVA